jgi:hypothetical protein
MEDQGVIDKDDEVVDVKMDERWLVVVVVLWWRKEERGDEEMRKGAQNKYAS